MIYLDTDTCDVLAELSARGANAIYICSETQSCLRNDQLAKPSRTNSMRSLARLASQPASPQASSFPPGLPQGPASPQPPTPRPRPDTTNRQPTQRNPSCHSRCIDRSDDRRQTGVTEDEEKLSSHPEAHPEAQNMHIEAITRIQRMRGRMRTSNMNRIEMNTKYSTMRVAHSAYGGERRVFI